MKRWFYGFLLLMISLGPVACRKTLLVSPRAISPATPTPIATVFFDDFSSDLGWTYDTEWQRGPATASIGQSYGNGDPAEDHTATSDNFLAGAVIGGNTTTDVHDFYFLTSPAFDVSSLPSLYLSFWRWYNSDYMEYAEGVVQVWDGVAWVTLYSTGLSPGVRDDAWQNQVFDLTPYRNGALQVRFGHRVGWSGAFTTSGWNLDDVLLSMDQPPTPVPTPTHTDTPTVTPTFTGYCGGDPSPCTPTDTPTDTPTATETPTCVHPLGISEDGLIPDHTPDAGTPIVFNTPVLVKSLPECDQYLPGNAFCSSVDFGLNSVILTRSVQLCYSTWLITGVEENCLGGLTVHATCNTGCYCCDPPDEYRYTLIPATTRAIDEILCLPP